MSIVRTRALACAAAVLAVWSGSGSAADTTVEFASPVRIKAGGAWLGGGRLFPSPVLHDVDGDGRRDVVVGDLFGKVTVASFVEAGDGGGALGAERPLQDRDGQPLRFHNW